MLASLGVVMVALFVLCGSPCAAEDGAAIATVEIARPIGNVYNERTTDGDAYPQSLGIRARLVRGRNAVVVDYRRNGYQTETRGAGTLTKYARIEGGTGTVAPFLARKSSFEVRLERRVGHPIRALGLASHVGGVAAYAYQTGGGQYWFQLNVSVSGGVGVVGASTSTPYFSIPGITPDNLTAAVNKATTLMGLTTGTLPIQISKTVNANLKFNAQQCFQNPWSGSYTAALKRRV